MRSGQVQKFESPFGCRGERRSRPLRSFPPPPLGQGEGRRGGLGGSWVRDIAPMHCHSKQGSQLCSPRCPGTPGFSGSPPGAPARGHGQAPCAPVLSPACSPPTGWAMAGAPAPPRPRCRVQAETRLVLEAFLQGRGGAGAPGHVGRSYHDPQRYAHR